MPEQRWQKRSHFDNNWVEALQTPLEVRGVKFSFKLSMTLRCACDVTRLAQATHAPQNIHELHAVHLG